MAFIFKIDSAADDAIEALADLLVRALSNDPSTRYVIPSPASRLALVPLFTTFVRSALKSGSVWIAVTEQGLAGAALWRPPEEPNRSDEEREDSSDGGMKGIAEALGEDVMGRVGNMVGHLNSVHHDLLSDPHWHLSFLAVEPAEQGKGIGSSLIKAVTAQIESASAYLETFEQRNVTLYKRHGFVIVGEGEIPGSDIHYWAMRRN